ncbi:MAG TPA: glycine cleavage system protein GcvH [Chloroflexota bacterium]|nr:glycine cleavage system protein GcvH [Chloroflexota bacterium]HEX2988780.1 glycine cleavage system protein GcvH [Chloroflexota bacterium]
MVPKELRFSKEHEWVKVEGGEAVIGISDHAQEELGDVVYVELPSVGQQLEQFKTFGVVESVKAASDLYSPVSGEVIAVNSDLTKSPEKVNEDPYGSGWMIRLRLKDSSELNNLMDSAAYESEIAKG